MWVQNVWENNKLNTSLDLYFCSRVKKLLEAGEVYMGGQHDESDKYIAPTIIHNIQPTDPIMQEEVNCRNL